MTGSTDVKSWKEELKEVWPYAISVTTLLFFTASMTAWFVTWQIGPKHPFGYVLAIIDPALTAVIMIVMCVLRPAVFSGRPFAFPHMFTLPLLYMAVVYGIKLMGRDAATVQRLDLVEPFDLIWLDTNRVLVVFVGMVVVMSAVGAFKSKPALRRP